MGHQRNARRIAKILFGLFGLLLVYALLHVLVALHPGLFFPHRSSHGRFDVHLREEAPPELAAVLDLVEQLLATSSLDEPARRRPVYLFNDRPLVSYLLLRDVQFGANLPNGATWIVDSDIPRNVARCRRRGPLDQRRRSLSESIAHEIGHAMLREHLGRRAARRAPSWITEGYCEFVAQGGAIDPALGLRLLREGGGSAVPGFPQFRNRLMVEYLIRQQGLGIEEILASPPDFARTHAALLAGLEADAASLLTRLRSRD